LLPTKATLFNFCQEKVACLKMPKSWKRRSVFRAKNFDPISQPPYSTVPSGLERASQVMAYYIVQFGMTATDELLESLKATGVEICNMFRTRLFSCTAAAKLSLGPQLIHESDGSEAFCLNTRIQPFYASKWILPEK
jgi:hypothetical protein